MKDHLGEHMEQISSVFLFTQFLSTIMTGILFGCMTPYTNLSSSEKKSWNFWVKGTQKMLAEFF